VINSLMHLDHGHTSKLGQRQHLDIEDPALAVHVRDDVGQAGAREELEAALGVADRGGAGKGSWRKKALLAVAGAADKVRHSCGGEGVTTWGRGIGRMGGVSLLGSLLRIHIESDIGIFTFLVPKNRRHTVASMVVKR
jgi:hypothetical protein